MDPREGIAADVVGIPLCPHAEDAVKIDGVVRLRLRPCLHLLVLALALGSGCSDVEGHLVASGPPLGSWSMSPDKCRSDALDGLFGVVLTSSGQPGSEVHVIRDPIDAAPYVRIKTRAAFVELGGNGCDEFDVELWTEQRSTLSDDDDFIDVSSRDLTGHLVLSCLWIQGGEVQGDVTFDRC